jgi:hypothetical protein
MEGTKAYSLMGSGSGENQENPTVDSRNEWHAFEVANKPTEAAIDGLGVPGPAFTD